MNDWIQRKSPRLKGYRYDRPGYYFVTICTALRGQDVLSTIPVGGGLCPAPPGGASGSSPAVMLTSIGQVLDKSIREIPQRYAGVRVDAYCIMPDHVHMIVVIESKWENPHGTGRDRARPLQDIIGAMKSYTDRQYRLLGTPFEVKLWQTSYYDHIIRSPEDLEKTRRYIQNNPMNWILDKE